VSGYKNDWDRWSINLLAEARHKGHRNLLIGIEIVPTKGSKRYEEFMIRNNLEFIELLISYDYDI
jgi:hypothetical protein